MKKSDQWLLREGISRDIHKIYTRVDEFLTNYDKKHEETQYKVLQLEGEMKKLKKMI